MPIARINSLSKDSFYFVTPTLWNWYYLFDRHHRWEILADSLTYCQQHKSLETCAYVFMLNHIHMIFRSNDAVAVLRDFKRHTSRALKENIQKTEPNVSALFVRSDGTWRLWKEDNQPRLIETERFLLQKRNYIHNNPVRKGYVLDPSHWKWSSANPQSPLKINRIAF